MAAKGLRIDTILLDEKIPVDALLQRQIVEGVAAVTFLLRQAQQVNRIPLRVFDRSAGSENVRFDGKFTG